MQIVEMFEKTNETTLESARRLAELNQRAFDRLFQQQAELASFYLDASARGLELVTKAKGYQDLMAGQVALMRECGERNLAALREGVAFATVSSAEYGNLAREQYDLAQESLKQAAKSAI